jgi:hypothetical protein
MEYLIGLGLALAVAGLGAGVGFDRDRSFTPTVLIVIASYYVLFAILGGSTRSVVIESVVAAGFLLLAVFAFRGNLWLIAVAMVGHGVFDFFHHLLIHNPGVPNWWPGFCLAFDVTFGGYVAVVLSRHSRPFLLRTPVDPRGNARA